jgi:hypothetical protein
MKNKDLPPLPFKPLDEAFVVKHVNKINVKKATCVDDIPPLLLKLALPSIAKPLASLVNKSIEKSVFPNSL